MMSSCFSFAFNYMTTYEQQSIGLHFDNMMESPVEDDALNFFYCCLMLIFDALLYGSIAIVILIGIFSSF